MFVKNGGAYKVTRHQYKINFRYYTYIHEIGEVVIPKYEFEFIPFTDSFFGFTNSDYLVGM